MTSKWIEEVYEILSASAEETYLPDVLNRIDKLLRLSMHSTDDENLSDEIRKELNGTN
jgi:hypothetical protein